MMVAGEASGDLHASRLAQSILAIQPDARLFGMGGGLMKEAGVRLLFNPTAISTIGFLEALRSLQLLRRLLLRLGEVMDRHRPDVLVLVDFPGFNMRLAEMAKSRGIPVVYYISPQVWAWGRRRAHKVAETVTKVCSIFPFEAEVYREAGANVVFVGHPLLDIVRPGQGREATRHELSLGPDDKLVVLMPGSREQEISQLAPMMAQAASRIQEAVGRVHYASPVAHTVSEGRLATFFDGPGRPPVRLFRGRTYDLMAAGDAAIIACGTATLEAALMSLPHAAVYRVSQSTYQVARFLLRIPYVALPNIVAGEMVVPELLQKEANPERMAEELIRLLTDDAAASRMREAFRNIAERIGPPGAIARTAEVVLSVARGVSE